MGVGKTFLVNRFAYGIIPAKNLPTVGIEYTKKVVELSNGNKLMAQIWDTGNKWCK